MSKKSEEQDPLRGYLRIRVVTTTVRSEGEVRDELTKLGYKVTRVKLVEEKAS